ncbi:hypothetical protein Enr13x_28240 [Stieleria neptunia]|uniref:Uncharacterized protein n=1 Tax=Stieleria neptunia TaxID=2527979 RepID=A0A518HQ54_9BACT|nr:hypothetical protein [Stieleria neptunia]QDV42972.1 hypothetical protein Enr13x_28240 [Stieleria neptunia]
MTDYSAEPFAVLGNLVSSSSVFEITSIVVAVLITIASYRRSILWLGDASPGYLACAGWLLGMSVANVLLIVIPAILMGQAGKEIIMLFVFFMTVYWTSCAAKCGLTQSIFILMVHSCLSVLGMALFITAASVFQLIVVETQQAITLPSGDTPSAALEPLDESTAANPVGLRPIQSDPPPVSRSQHRDLQGTKANPFFQ